MPPPVYAAVPALPARPHGDAARRRRPLPHRPHSPAGRSETLLAAHHAQPGCQPLRPAEGRHPGRHATPPVRHTADHSRTATAAVESSPTPRVARQGQGPAVATPVGAGARRRPAVHLATLNPKGRRRPIAASSEQPARPDGSRPPDVDPGSPQRGRTGCRRRHQSRRRPGRPVAGRMRRRACRLRQPTQ